MVQGAMNNTGAAIKGPDHYKKEVNLPCCVLKCLRLEADMAAGRAELTWVPLLHTVPVLVGSRRGWERRGLV